MDLNSYKRDAYYMIILCPIFAVFMFFLVIYMGKIFNVYIQFNPITVHMYITAFCIGVGYGIYYWRDKLKYIDSGDSISKIIKDFSKAVLNKIFLISLILAILSSILLFNTITFSIIVFWAIYIPGVLFGALFGEYLSILKIIKNINELGVKFGESQCSSKN
ncbi:hypothetical protein MFS40622_1376 [Methanocaldococcus sp. FS406-22]|uniref:hypothetical protein n=1 Tax=Methanocaldococcus sp. (strain FS406-22) TaxID=644281 RepID=UPI0001BF47FF|nr:hypothetical protein [Methanocaldococcus sp. FS406-22]ADC70052.1 hypothetical protein MFS40622_1376 [Methanocaldococcus sp. FS406-22]